MSVPGGKGGPGEGIGSGFLRSRADKRMDGFILYRATVITRWENAISVVVVDEVEYGGKQDHVAALRRYLVCASGGYKDDHHRT
jgi:hypothetical protein